VDRRRLTAALALACAALLCACTFSRQRFGDDRFLGADVDWEPGRTTVREVAAALGPPDLVRWSDDRLVFVYRYQQVVRTSFALNFYLNLFSRDQAGQVDGTLVVGFDDRDRLVWWGASRAEDASPMTRTSFR
jgi:hypothetical protein